MSDLGREFVHHIGEWKGWVEPRTGLEHVCALHLLSYFTGVFIQRSPECQLVLQWMLAERAPG